MSTLPLPGHAREAVPNILAINGLRGICIIGVLWHHGFAGPILHQLAASGDVLARFWVPPLMSGWMGVSMFFLLSGTVLYLPYVTGLRRMDRNGTAQFYKRRAKRLLPLYFLVLAISIVFGPGPKWPQPEFWRELALTLTMTFPFSPLHYQPAFNWVMWSLGVEAIFSVIFPAVVILIQRIGLWPVLVGAFLFSNASRLLGYTVVWAPLDGQPAGFIAAFLTHGLPASLDLFVMGMLVAHLLVHRRLPSAAWTMTALGLIGGYSGILLHEAVNTGVLGRSAYLLATNVVQLSFLALALGAVALEQRGQRTPFTLGLLQTAGMMSYSLYLWHGIILVRIMPQSAFGISWAAPMQIAQYLVLTLVISALTYRYFEFGAVADWRRLFPMFAERPPAIMPKVGPSQNGARR